MSSLLASGSVSSDPPERARRTGAAILRRVLVRNRRALAFGTALVCVHQLAETAVPISIGLVIDRAVETSDTAILVVSVLGLAALFLVLTAAWRMGARLVVAAMQTEAHRLRLEVAHRALDPRGLRTDLRSGEVLTISTSDAEQASWIADVVPRAAAALTAAVASAVALVWIDLWLGLAVLIGTPVILGLLQLAAPLITSRAGGQQASIARASAMATDLVSGLRPLRGVGGEAAASERYRGASRQALASAVSTAKATGVYTGVAATVSALLAVGVAGFAGYFALQGRISVGELITVVGLAQFVIEPLGLLASLPGYFAVARASSDRLALVLGADPARDAGSAETLAGTDLTLEGVAYKSLRHIDLQLRAGELVGVVASQPQDADALVAVLSGQLPSDAYRGVVRVGGIDLSDMELRLARRTVLVEPHITDLFAGSLGSNVTAGDRDAHDREIRSALEASAAAEIVAAHPDGLELEVTDRGASLSGGQRQRVALARALVAKSPVLVLHDPTTAVDAVTEASVAEGIARLRHDESSTHTTVLVTASPALLAVTDRVIVVDDGVIAAVGTHAELSRGDLTYRGAVLR